MPLDKSQTIDVEREVENMISYWTRRSKLTRYGYQLMIVAGVALIFFGKTYFSVLSLLLAFMLSNESDSANIKSAVWKLFGDMEKLKKDEVEEQ